MSDTVPHRSLQPTVEDDTEGVEDAPSLTAPANGAGVSAPEPTDAEIEARLEQERRSSKPKPQAPLDISSQDAFPSLLPSAAPAASAGLWGNRPKSAASALAAAPKAASGKPPLGNMNLPGKFVDRVELKSSQLIPPSKLGKSVQAILADIKKHTGAHVTVRTGPMGVVIFEAQGMKKAVQQALREVVELVGLKQSVQHPIPSSVRPFIIGKQGSTIQGIIERTKARIQMPRQDNQSPTDEDDEVMVTIEGNPLSVMLAQKEIDDIVNERTSTLNANLRDIPPELYPFLIGPENSGILPLENSGVQVVIPDYHTWANQPPARSETPGHPGTFFPRSDLPIQLFGDRSAVQEARRVLEQRAEELKSRLSVDQLPVERGRHQFIVGEKGISVQDFLQETGCSVVLPPADSDSEFLNIIGPANCIEAGINKVEDLASRMVMSTVDVARQHNNSHAHAHNLTRYFRNRAAVNNLERLHNASIVLPNRSDGPCAWELYSSDGKSLYRARNDIMNLVTSHPPSRLAQLNVNPFFHPFIREKFVPQIRADYGVHLVFPDEPSSDTLLLVCESRSPLEQYQFPTQAPTAADISSFEKALAQAKEHLNSIISGYPSISTRELEAEPKFHDKIRRFVSQRYGQVPEDRIVPQLLFADPSSANSPSRFDVRGSEDMVEALIPEILEFLEQEKQDELERSYTTSFDFPQKYVNFLIGKGGENIKKLREEFDVEIRVHDGRVDLQGPQAKAARAKAHILSLGKKWADETTAVLKIDPQYHSELIGPGGSQVNRLQDRYHVRVNFPRSSFDDSDSPAENRARGRAQAPDEIVIKGPSQGVANARSELQDLFKYIAENSNTTTVSVDRNLVPMLIGQAGRELERLRLSTGAKIDIPGKTDNSSDRVDIKLKGTKQQIATAKSILEERSASFDSTVTKTIDVDRKHHKNLIGSEGSNIRQILTAAGFTSDDPRERARVIRFPHLDSTDNTITVQGPETMVNKIIEAIQKQVSQREDQLTEVIDVPVSNHRQLVGPNGETRRQLEAEFGVQVDIPRRGTTGPAATQIKITGLPAKVNACKTKIEELVKRRSEEAIEVPRRLHHQIADSGNLFRRLRREFNVTVDHSGHEVPSKPTPPQASKPEILPGDISEPVLHILSPPTIAEGEAGDSNATIPWILRGPPEKLSQARKVIESALTSANKGEVKCTGYLFLPDTSVYRKVVGPGGSHISAIRRETGTSITVPKNDEVDLPITIVGTREGIERAKELIVDRISQ